MKAKAFFSKMGGVSPLTPWVSQPAIKAKPEGYVHYEVTHLGFVFHFASLYELDACVQILSRKNLPPSTPNGHWLSRLPGWVKTWRYREKAVKALSQARKEFLKRGDAWPSYTPPSEAALRSRQRRNLPTTIAKRIAQRKNVRQ